MGHNDYHIRANEWHDNVYLKRQTSRNLDNMNYDLERDDTDDTELPAVSELTATKRAKSKEARWARGNKDKLSGDPPELRERRIAWYEGSPGKKMTQLNTDLINEVCEYLAFGATNISVCRTISVHPETFNLWLRKGRELVRDGIECDPIYGELYLRYQQARGQREVSWIERIKDPKWLITHHPDTKQQWAELRYQKNELSGSISPGEASDRKLEAEKRIGEAIGNIRLQQGRQLPGEEDNGEVSEESGQDNGSSPE